MNLIKTLSYRIAICYYKTCLFFRKRRINVLLDEKKELERKLGLNETNKTS